MNRLYHSTGTYTDELCNHAVTLQICEYTLNNLEQRMNKHVVTTPTWYVPHIINLNNEGLTNMDDNSTKPILTHVLTHHYEICAGSE